MGNTQPVKRPTRLARWVEKIGDKFQATKEDAKFGRSVVDLDGYENFEDCSRSEEKKTEKHPLIASSPPQMERKVELEESADKPSPRKSLDANRNQEVPNNTFRVFRLLLPISYEKLMEYKLRLKSEMAKERGAAYIDVNLDRYYDLSFKNLNGCIQVKFERRLAGGGVQIDKEVLQRAIQRAEELVMLDPIAGIGCDPQNRIVVKRITDGEKTRIEFVNVPKKSCVAIAVCKLLIRFVCHICKCECLAFGSTQKGLHSFRIAPESEERAEFAGIDLVKFEDLVVRTAAEKISLLEEDGIDIHHCDVDDLIEHVQPAVRLDLSKALSIDFT